MKNRLRFLPLLGLSLAALAGVAVIGVSARLSMRQFSLGVHLQGDIELPGALVTAVDPEGPSATILTPNDVILAIHSVGGRSLTLEPADMVPDPDVFPTFSALNGFLSRQGTLLALLEGPVVSLDLEDGRTLRVQPSHGRRLGFLPAGFWLVNLIGLTAFLIGFSVWSARRRDAAPRLLLGTGVAFLLMAATVAVITTRELALAPAEHRLLQACYHAGNDLFTVFGIALLYHYPKRLARVPAVPLLLLMVLPFWLNERFQWTELPGHTVLVQVPLYFTVAVGIAVLQWMRARRRPADRAAFRWFLFTLFGCVGISVMIYFVPMAFLGHGVVPIGAGLGSVLLLYVGLALGVLRYRLFDLDRWWFDIWLWFLAGAALVAVDVVLVLVVSLAQPVALTLALLLVGWFYFPARQWLWNRMFRASRRRIEDVLPMLIAGLLDRRRSGPDALERALRELFQPAALEKSSRRAGAVSVVSEGEGLYVPAIGASGGLELRYADHGARLFSRPDVRMAEALHQIVKRTEDQLDAYNRGATEERERIMRDLHDDVGGRLLSLVHAAPVPKIADLARDALKSLRDIIYSLSPGGPITLEEALGKWRYDCRQRCEQAGVRLDWTDAVDGAAGFLSARQWVNLSRVVYEATSNAFAHAAPSALSVRWELEDVGLKGRIRNDGRMPDPATRRSGKGLKNMETRLSEIGGTLFQSVDPVAGDFEIRLFVPLSEKRLILRKGADGAHE